MRTRRWLAFGRAPRPHRMAAACAAVLVAGAASACSVHPLTPAPAAGAPTGPAGWRAPPRTPVIGVDLYAKGNYPAPVVRRDGRRALRYIRHTLGAASVGIAWNFFEPDIHANQVQATAGTLTPANVRTLTRLAYAQHLSVEYRPLIEVQAHLGSRGLINPQNWEGFIAPQNQAQWFGSYYQAELPYLRIAQQLHVREFVTGSELMYLNSSGQWPSFFHRVGQVYHGMISYAAEQRNFFPGYGTQHLLKVRYYGVDAYPSIYVPPTATVGQLVAGWDRLFRGMPGPLLYQTALDEVGIRATDNAYYHPSLWGIPGKFDETVQARWFTAACHVVQEHHMRAIYFWNVNLADDPAHPPFPSPPTFEGKAAVQSIKTCLTNAPQQ